MPQNHFVWTDLSTFDMNHARTDYAKLFGWRFWDDPAYDFATLGEEPVAAVFPMPAALAKINMPSFWMSYVAVVDVDVVVEKARAHDGAIIEVEPQAFGDDAIVALIRDPMGAGFTVYQGPEIGQSASGVGRVMERYYHAPDINAVASFYKDLFGWTFQPMGTDPWPTFVIADHYGAPVAVAEQIPDEIRGKFRYWMPCFGVADTSRATQTLQTQGGAVHWEIGDGRHLAADAQGAHFLFMATT